MVRTSSRFARTGNRLCETNNRSSSDGAAAPGSRPTSWRVAKLRASPRRAEPSDERRRQCARRLVFGRSVWLLCAQQPASQFNELHAACKSRVCVSGAQCHLETIKSVDGVVGGVNSSPVRSVASRRGAQICHRAAGAAAVAAAAEKVGRRRSAKVAHPAN